MREYWWFGLWLGVGVLFFFAGAGLIREGFRSCAGSRAEAAVRSATRSPVRAFLVGILATSMLQSSSLTTISIIGLVDAGGVSSLGALGFILGANIGTTATVQIAGLSLEEWGLVILMVGTALYIVFARAGTGRQAALVIAGLGSILTAMQVLSASFGPLAGSPVVRRLLEESARSPAIGMVAGGAATALVQSSSAVMAIVVSMARAGLMSLPIAIGIVLGSNMGTCLDTLVASVPLSKTARRLALTHLMVNVAGAVVFLPLASALGEISLLLSAGNLPGAVANAHTLFNVFTAAAILPFVPVIDRLYISRGTREI